MRVKIQEFRVLLQNQLKAVNIITDVSFDTINYNLTSIIKERAIEVGGFVTRRKTGKLSQETKKLIKRRPTKKASNATDKIELVVLSKLFNRRKVADFRRYNIERIEQALKSGRRLKAAKADSCIGINCMCALRNKEGIVITNINRIVKMPEEF